MMSIPSRGAHHVLRSKWPLARLLTFSVLLHAPLLGFSSAQAAPGCSSRFWFCDNCARAITLTTKRNVTCVISYRVANGAVFSQKVVKRGIGVYGTTNSTSGAYRPKPGYVGRDYFEVEIRYTRGASTHLTTTLQATVTVTD